MENQISKILSIILSIVVTLSFLIYIDFIKKLIKNKIPNQLLKSDKFLYRDYELKYFFPYAVIILFVYILIFAIIAPYINFDVQKIYFDNDYSLKDIILKIIIMEINLLFLYLGLIIEIILKLDYLMLGTSFINFMSIIFVPFLEEFIYRGIIFSLLKQSGFKFFMSALLSGLLFSISHFRHIFDPYFDKRQIARIYFQGFYTFLSGFYYSYAYNYSGNIITPSILHSTCNLLQFPHMMHLRLNINKKLKNFISFAYIFGIIAFITMITIFH